MFYQSHDRARHEIFTTDFGRKMLESVREFCARHGEFTALDVMDAVCRIHGISDAWCVLNALDQLVTECEIMELTAGQRVRGQDRRFKRL